MKQTNILKPLVFLLSILVLSINMNSCVKKDSRLIDLSGEWSFQIDSLDVGINQKWFIETLDDTIALPGSMPEQRKGFSVGYNTKFTGSIWKGYPNGGTWADDENYKPYLTKDKFRFPFWLISDYHYVGRAWYQKEVIVPENWQGKSVELYLERPHWETHVWINGEHAGLQNALGVAHKYNH